MTGKELRHIRINRLRMTQKELAIRLGKTSRTIRTVENGEKEVHRMLALAIRSLRPKEKSRSTMGAQGEGPLYT